MSMMRADSYGWDRQEVEAVYQGAIQLQHSYILVGSPVSFEFAVMEAFKTYQCAKRRVALGEPKVEDK